MENLQPGKENLENLAELAQSLDKLQTQLNETVLNIDPESSKFTLGVFWRKYKFSIKLTSAIVLPSVIALWSIFNWWGHIEHNFEKMTSEIHKVHSFNAQHEKKVETFTSSFEKIIENISIKSPSDVYEEVILLRRYLADSLTDIKTIKNEVDKIFIITLLEKYNKNGNNQIIEKEIEDFFKINSLIKDETSENTIINY